LKKDFDSKEKELNEVNQIRKKFKELSQTLQAQLDKFTMQQKQD
jgi:hypothetical protein